MIIRISDDRYLMVLERLCSENKFIAAAKVRPGSPAAELASRMYCCLFKAAIELTAEYEKYYAIEYKTIWHYLYWHHSIDADVIDRVRGAYKSGMHILYSHLYSGGDYVIGQYIGSEEGFSLVERIINVATKEQF